LTAKTQHVVTISRAGIHLAAESVHPCVPTLSKLRT
jgi:hypothetical protein